MSQLTECTCVIYLKDEECFVREYNEWKDVYRIRNFRKAYQNKDFMIYIFDCNGASPWMIEDSIAQPLISETCYGREIWTEGIGKTKRYESTDRKGIAINRLRKIYEITDSEYNEIKQKTAYSFF